MEIAEGDELRTRLAVRLQKEKRGEFLEAGRGGESRQGAVFSGKEVSLPAIGQR